MMFKRILAGAAVAAALAVPSMASASVTITSITADPGFRTGRVSYAPGGIGGNPATTVQDLNIGRFRLAGVDNDTTQAVVFETYCIDIFNYIKTGTFEIETFALADALKQQQVQKLLGHTAGFISAAATLTSKKDTSAAIQMAVWEIINEAGTSGYSLGSGQFRIDGSYGTVNPAARAMAQGYLDAMGGWAQPSGFGYRMMTAINPQNNQRQIFLAAGVPEPSAWALLIAGFGVVGGAMRSRRRPTFASA